MNFLNLNRLPGAFASFIEKRHSSPDAPCLRSLLHEDSGQDLIEYALVAALVGLGAVAALKTLKTSIGNSFNSVGSTLTSST